MGLISSGEEKHPGGDKESGLFWSKWGLKGGGKRRGEEREGRPRGESGWEQRINGRNFHENFKASRREELRGDKQT